MLRAIEGKGHGLIDRHSDCFGSRVDPRSRRERQWFQFSPVFPQRLLFAAVDSNSIPSIPPRYPDKAEKLSARHKYGTAKVALGDAHSGRRWILGLQSWGCCDQHLLKFNPKRKYPVVRRDMATKRAVTLAWITVEPDML